MDHSQPLRKAESNIYTPVNPFSRPRTVIVSGPQQPRVQDGGQPQVIPRLGGGSPRSSSVDRILQSSSSGRQTSSSILRKEKSVDFPPTLDGPAPPAVDGPAPPALTEPLPLQHFSTVLASRLPLAAVVHSGEYRDQNQHVVVSVGDKLQLQHLQNVRVVKLQGVLTKHSFTVPLSSTTYLSLLYTANSETIHGSVFKKVSNLMVAKPLPKVVCATKAWSNSSVSIRNPEILIPIERVQNGSVEGMVMFSLLDREEKFLPESCMGHFDTSPKMVSALLQDLIAHVPRVFSSTAYIDDPTRLNNKYVMIVGMDLETTIKCTAVDRQNGMPHDIDLPVSTHNFKLCVTEWGSGDADGHTPIGTTSSPVPLDGPRVPSNDPSDAHLPAPPTDPSGLPSSVNSTHSSSSTTSAQENTTPPQQYKQTTPLLVPPQLPSPGSSLGSTSTTPPTGVPAIPPREPLALPCSPPRGQVIPSRGDMSAPNGDTPSPRADDSKSDVEGGGEDQRTLQLVPGDFTATSPNISLLDLVRQYQMSLPVHVKVQGGQGGQGKSTQTAETEYLTIRHVRYLEVVTAVTSDGSSLDVPHGTDLKFSVLYDAIHDLKEAIKGFLFKGVTTLVSRSPRPPMVWVKEGWSSEVVSIEKDEILFPRKFRPDPEGLAVFSLGTRSEKLLPLSCTAVFSSNANHTLLHLCDIVAYPPKHLPMQGLYSLEEVRPF